MFGCFFAITPPLQPSYEQRQMVLKKEKRQQVRRRWYSDPSELRYDLAQKEHLEQRWFFHIFGHHIGRDEDHLILKKWKSKRMAADGSLHISWPNEVLKTDWRCYCSSKQSGVKWLFKSLSLAAIASRAFFLPLAPVADVILLIYSKVNRKKTFTLFRQWSNRTNMTITLFAKPPKMSRFLTSFQMYWNFSLG